MSTSIYIPIRAKNAYPTNGTIRKQAQALTNELIRRCYGKQIIKHQITNQRTSFDIQLWFSDNSTTIITTTCPNNMQLEKTDAHVMLSSMLKHLQKFIIFGKGSDFFTIHIKNDQLIIDLNEYDEKANTIIEIVFDENRSLEAVVTELQSYQNSDKIVYCDFHDTLLCSSGLTINKAYYLLTGMHKDEYETYWEQQRNLNRILKGFPKNN